MGGAGIQIFLRILRCNSAANLQTARKRLKRLQSLAAGRLVKGTVFRIQDDDVAVLQPFLFKKGCIPGRRFLGNKILLSLIAGIRNASAHQLLHLSVMNINTGSELHLFLLKTFSRFCRIQ